MHTCNEKSREREGEKERERERASSRMLPTHKPDELPCKYLFTDREPNHTVDRESHQLTTVLA